MKNRILSVILTLVMLVSMMSAIAIPTSAATIAFTKNPAVLISGDGEYNIIFETNNVSIGYVTYTVDGVAYTVYDEENGVVRTDDAMHTVRVPQDQLDAAGSYTVVAKTVSSRDGYTITTSDQVTKTNTFNGYKGQETVTFGFASDTHYNPNKSPSNYMAQITDLVNNTLGRPDVMVLNGDITDSLSTKAFMDGLFEVIYYAGSDGTYPVLYVVGNHEKRGEYANEIEKYLTYSNGEFYTYFEYGPLAAFVSDVGEDKSDANMEYTASEEDKIGVIDMERYYAEQLNYFKKYSGYAKDATYTFTIGHGPGYAGNDTNPTKPTDFIEYFDAIGTDIHFYGHNHQLEYRENSESCPYPRVGVCSDGKYGTTGFRGVKVTFATDADDYNMYNLTAYNANKSVAWTAELDTDENGAPKDYVEPEEEEVVEEEEEEEFKAPSANTTSDTVTITTAPVVFDAGDYYNVVWQTDVESAGYVYVDGTEKYYMDQHGGIIREEKTHSVRIPKADLAGKTFIIMNRVITNFSGSGHYYTDPSTWLTFGEYATGPAVKMNALPTGENYTVLAVANKADATSLNEKYTGTPDLVVLAGDVVANLNTEADFASLLTFANAVSKGKAPVMLLRGEGEATGAYAAELTRVLHTAGSLETMNKLYGATTAGNVTVIGLDTATAKADADASYNGYAAFDTIRADQAEWLENSDVVADGNYGVVFANAADLTNAAGTDLTKGFANQNVQLAVVAGETTSYAAGEDFAVATIGTADALVITCGADEITVTEISDAETPVTGEVAVTEKVPEEEPDEPVVPDEPAVDPNEPVDPSEGVAKVGENYYANVEAALAVANNETVTLVADATAGTAIINPGVTLDLNSHNLEAERVVGFNGSYLIDTNKSTKGKLYVAKDNVSLSSTPHESYPQLPVYNGDEGYYSIIKINLKRSSTYFSYNEAERKYSAQPLFGDGAEIAGGISTELFAQGSEANGVNIRVRVEWDDKNGTYTAQQDYTYTNETVNNVVSSFDGKGYTQKFTAVFTDAILRQGETVKISMVAESDTGVELVSNTITLTFSE